MNGISIGTWDEAVPDANESVGLGDDRIRSTKSTLRTALDDEHIWPSSGGTVGQHRLGSARAFFGTQSQVSASTTSLVANGRLMVASDTSRLFGVGSEGTLLFGAPGMVSIDSVIAYPQRSRWAMEVGVTAMAENIDVTFPNSGFSGVPYVQFSVFTTGQNGAGNIARCFKLFHLSASRFTGQIVDTTNNVGVSNAGLMWQSVGTRAL